MRYTRALYCYKGALTHLPSAAESPVLCISDPALAGWGCSPALQLTLATDESAWWCWALAPRGTMPGLFFVYVTAINSTWDEEPKSESNLMLDAPAGAGCHSRACSCFGAARGLSSEDLSASPRFHKLNWGPSRPGGR